MPSLFRAALLIGALACFSSQSLAVTVNNVFMTKGPAADDCTAQPATVTFTTGDPEVWIYALVLGAQINDAFTIEWLDGAGTLFASTSFDPVSEPGNWCFSGPLNTVTNPFVLTPGIWTARGMWNGAEFFALNFIVTTPLTATPTATSKLGAVALLRTTGLLQLDPASPAQDFSADVGLGAFVETTAAASLGFTSWSSALTSLLAKGGCQAYAGDVSLSATPGNPPTLPTPGSGSLLAPRQLDAGPALSVTGTKGTLSVPRLDPTRFLGTYLGILGGSFPLLATPALPLFLDPGTYTISGPGGTEVSAFTASTTIASNVTWSNRADLAAVNRAAPTPVTWTGGDATQIVFVAGASTGGTSGSAAFYCLAPATAGTFSVPASVLAVLPPTATATEPGSSLAVLVVGSLPATGFVPFTATGLDSAVAVNGALNVRTVTLQ